MKTDKEIPFYKNRPDGTHCFQAVLKMVMKYFWPEKSYSWKELDKITAKVKGKWTWPMAGLIWLQKRGVDVKVIEPFDYKKFAQIGSQYLIEHYGEVVGKAQIKHSDIRQEKKIAKEFIEKVSITKIIPTIDDLKNLLSQEYVVICNVNSHKLNKKKGYTGHFVVVKGFDDKCLFLHDPGPPARKNRSVNFDLFEKSWAYPNINTKNIIAVKLK